uniref:ERCC1-like central domain-containing protein n=1 Tax=Anolis carolinensis TaxID=28377 RepID=A0A803TQ36_ANOCA
MEGNRFQDTAGKLELVFPVKESCFDKGSPCPLSPSKSTTSAKPRPCEKRNMIAKAREETGSLNPVLKLGTKQSSIIISLCQQGNPILKFIRNVPWEFGDIIPDYLLSQSTCTLFLSLHYHNLNHNYIHEYCILILAWTPKEMGL